MDCIQFGSINFDKASINKHFLHRKTLRYVFTTKIILVYTYSSVCFKKDNGNEYIYNTSFRFRYIGQKVCFVYSATRT